MSKPYSDANVAAWADAYQRAIAWIMRPSERDRLVAYLEGLNEAWRLASPSNDATATGEPPT